MIASSKWTFACSQFEHGERQNKLERRRSVCTKQKWVCVFTERFWVLDLFFGERHSIQFELGSAKIYILDKSSRAWPQMLLPGGGHWTLMAKHVVQLSKDVFLIRKYGRLHQKLTWERKTSVLFLSIPLRHRILAILKQFFEWQMVVWNFTGDLFCKSRRIVTFGKGKGRGTRTEKIR